LNRGDRIRAFPFTGEEKGTQPDLTIRLVTIAAKPHQSGGHYARRGSTGPSCDGAFRIATNLLDVPAEIIATWTTIAGRLRSFSGFSSRFWAAVTY